MIGEDTSGESDGCLVAFLIGCAVLIGVVFAAGIIKIFEWVF